MPPATNSKPVGELEKLIELSAIVPSPFNHRKHFDPEKLGRLADSIKKVGLLQAVIVRPHPTPKKGVHYELVCGERRFRAAKKAGLSKIRAVVRTLADLDVIEIQVIENDQREDVTPLEKANGYQDMINHGRTIEQIAEKISKSPQTVRRVLRLLRLPKILAEAMELGRVPASVCELIVRIPNPDLREIAAKCVLLKVTNPRYLKSGRPDKGSEPLSFRETKELIAEHFIVQLKDATFDLLDATLVPKAGSCKDCPKRAGNDPDPHQGVQPDSCTDPICFRNKLKAQQDRTEADARRRGLHVIEPMNLGSVFQTWGGYTPGYIGLDERCWISAARGKTYRDLFGKKLDNKKISLAHDETHKPHWVMKKKDAEALLQSLGLIEASEDELSDRDRKSERLRLDVRAGAVYKLGRELATKAEKDPVVKLLDVPAHKGSEWHRDLLSAMCFQAIDSLQDLMPDMLALCRGRCELPPRGPGFEEGIVNRLYKWIERAPTSSLFAMLTEAFCLNYGNNSGDDALRQEDFAALVDQSWDEMIDEARSVLEATKKRPN